VETQVAAPSHAESQPSAARPGKSTDLGEWLADGQGLLEDIQTSLDSRYPTEPEEEPEAETSVGGIWIALAAFVPTFLLVVIGLPHLLLPSAAPPPPPAPMSVPVRSTAMLSPSFPGSMDRLGVPLPDFIETLAARGTWPNGAPGLPSTPERAEPKPVKSVSADTVPWARAAAFADDRAAARLADALRRQGYRVGLRLEDSATLPWVVWVSKSPAPSSSRK
jgi:hypothetical protein